MMPLLVGLDMLWRQLERLEHAHRPEAMRRPGYQYYDDFDDLEARTGRVQRLRGALFFSGVEAERILAERLAGINLSGVLRILVDACKDVALYWGGSVLAGGALGGAVGAIGGGVGALPGAALGAGLGSKIGAWVLGILGLKALLEDLGTALPEALGHYERGIRLAWGPVRHWEGTDSIFMDQIQASREIARGHVVLMMALLSALLAYLTRGRSDPAAKARILQEIRESRRLGPKVADWVAANEEALARHPGLKPREQQVAMAGAPAKDVGPPITPAELRRLREEGPPSASHAADAPKKPEPPAPPKVMQQKKVRCFEPNDLPKAKIPEFDRQLAGQERGLNDMTVGEYLNGRDAFDASHRNPQIAKQARAEYEQDLTRKLREQFVKQGLLPGEAAKLAAQQASAKMGTLAALHNPDMFAAGKDVISDFGDRSVNSRIGAQWKSRAGDLDAAAKQVAPAERATTKMNAKLERC